MLQINELIRQTLGEIINEEIEFPQGVILTITRVQTSRDLHHAKVYVSILPDEKRKQVFGILVEERKNLQQILAGSIVLRHTPKIRFAFDESEGEAVKMDELLDGLAT